MIYELKEHCLWLQFWSWLRKYRKLSIDTDWPY